MVRLKFGKVKVFISLLTLLKFLLSLLRSLRSVLLQVIAISKTFAFGVLLFRVFGKVKDSKSCTLFKVS